jgi:hypothetical protein
LRQCYPEKAFVNPHNGDVMHIRRGTSALVVRVE